MKRILITASMIAFSWISMAQSTEIGYNVGLSNYLGDLKRPDLSYTQPGFATGIFARQNITSGLSFRGFINYARLRGDDKFTRDQNLINRNLSFRSFVLEYGVMAEISLLPYDTYNQRNKSFRRYFDWTPYIFGGFNVFHFNPKTYYNGQWIALQPLGTEGQGTSFNTVSRYSLTQVAIPFGLGFKFQPMKRITVGMEFGARKTFTDYLDDVSGRYPDMARLAAERGSIAAELSYRGDELPHQGANDYPGNFTQRGDPNDMDWYLINTVYITYKFYPAKRAFTGR